MPYPAKTNAQTILTAAIEHLEQYGEEALSMRELASSLGLSPRALYRYYPDRAALEAAILGGVFLSSRRNHAEEGARGIRRCYRRKKSL
jgi:AcrR family transcriptional regulator